MKCAGQKRRRERERAERERLSAKREAQRQHLDRIRPMRPQCKTKGCVGPRELRSNYCALCIADADALGEQRTCQQVSSVRQARLKQERDARRARRYTTCSNPRCSEPSVEGKRFCQEHADQLAEIKAAMDAEIKARRGRTNRTTGICSSVGCSERRAPGLDYCAECSAQPDEIAA